MAHFSLQCCCRVHLTAHAMSSANTPKSNHTACKRSAGVFVARPVSRHRDLHNCCMSIHANFQAQEAASAVQSVHEQATLQIMFPQRPSLVPS